MTEVNIFTSWLILMYEIDFYGYRISFQLFLLVVSDLSKEEVTIAKQYPAHTALCIRDGWEFSSPERAAGWFSKVYDQLWINICNHFSITVKLIEYP